MLGFRHFFWGSNSIHNTEVEAWAWRQEERLEVGKCCFRNLSQPNQPSKQPLQLLPSQETRELLSRRTHWLDPQIPSYSAPRTPIARSRKVGFLTRKTDSLREKTCMDLHLGDVLSPSGKESAPCRMPLKWSSSSHSFSYSPSPLYTLPWISLSVSCT